MHEKIKKLVKEYPQKTIQLLEEWAEKIPKEAEEEIDNKLYGASIRKMETMEEAIRLAEKYTNKSKAWSYETAKQVMAEMGISTEEKKYTCYDINFVATLKYLVHGKTLSDLNAKPQTFMRMALDELCLDSEYGYDHYVELYNRYN